MRKGKVIGSILNHIDNRQYDLAIVKIDEYLQKTTCVRKLVNLKAKCYINLGQFSNALNLYNDYFPYCMIDEEDVIAINNLCTIHKYLGNEIQAKKYENSYISFTKSKDDLKQYLSIEEVQRLNDYNDFICNREITKAIENLIIENIQLIRITEAAVYFSYAKRKGLSLAEKVISEFSLFNQAFNFANELSINTSNIYCVITSTSNSLEVTKDGALVKALSYLGKQVYHVLPRFEDKNTILNYNSCTETNEINTRVISIKLNNSNIQLVNQISNILSLLNSNNNSNQPILLFGDSRLLMEINEDIENSRILEMYFRHFEDQPISRKDCLLLGPYFKSISYIWGYDVEKEFNKEPECDFSIIIPVRNSTKYLKETIETCINQDYDGSYEILISDNSSATNINVLSLIKEIDNSKIRYISTPFDLCLAKSFEYAYLNSRGKYLLAIGSDDGLIRNGLSKINEAFNHFPDNSIVQWPRAIYVWPDSSNSKTNILTYKYEYLNDVQPIELQTKPLIEHFAQTNSTFTDMPVLYMVTCIKRSHINKIFKYTGKFEDGGSQDVYTGFINLFIENKITYIEHPIVIGGDSVASLGNQAYKPVNSLKSIADKIRSNFSTFRFRNYYSESYRKTTTVTGFGIYLLMYKEFLKVNHLKIKNVASKESDIVRILFKSYAEIPTINCDNNLYTKQLERIAKNYSDTIYKSFLKKIAKLDKIKLIENIVISLIKKLNLESLFRNYYNFYSEIKLNNSVYRTTKIDEVKIIVNEKKSKVIQFDLNKYNQTGINSAENLLFEEIKKSKVNILKTEL